MSWRGWQSGKSWWNRKLGRGGESRSVRVRGRFKPGLLELEDRRLPSTFVVSSTADDASAGTLRWAVQQADQAGDGVIIDFSPTVFSTPQTITLSQGELTLSSGITVAIVGPGPGSADHQRPGCQRGVPGRPGGDGDDLRADDHRRQARPWAAACTRRGTATLTDCTISGNSATDYGGGVYSVGALTLTDCTISGNSAYLRRRRVRRRHGHADRLHDQRQLRRPERRRPV